MMKHFTIEPQNLPAGLYIVATPIGNLKDISLRALETLSSVDKILCEDTRVSQKLLAHYGITKPLEALHDHNEAEKAQKITNHITQGQSIALISDAGTPLISDPGFILVRMLKEQGLFVTHIPGASSIITALTLSSIPSDKFTFHGFLPTKSQARQDILRDIQQSYTTAIVLESPHRIMKTLQDICHIMGDDHDICLCRELTKKFEQCLHLPAKQLLDLAHKQNGFKGEIVLVIAPCTPQTYEADQMNLDAQILQALQHYRIKDVAHMLSEQTGLKKKDIYQRALELQSGNHHDESQ